VVRLLHRLGLATDELRFRVFLSDHVALFDPLSFRGRSTRVTNSYSIGLTRKFANNNFLSTS
jgi:hypothetical protein